MSQCKVESKLLGAVEKQQLEIEMGIMKRKTKTNERRTW